MLVLSRNKNQKVNFPGLGISVEILDIQGSKVRVGVDAPLEVRILRDELVDEFSDKLPVEPHVIRLPQSLRHELRNTLNELSLMLHVYQKRQEQCGEGALSEKFEPEQMFEAIVGRLSDLTEHDVFSSKGLLAEESAGSPDKLGVALVVDDDDNERELLAGFLRMCGYRVDTACDGLEAIDYLKTHESPAFVLLDMHMPRCNGAEFLRQLRQSSDWSQIHVFVVSGSTPKEHGLLPDQGFTRWFAKPLDPRQIVEELQHIELALPEVA